MAETPVSTGGNTLAAICIALLVGVFGVLALLAAKLAGGGDGEARERGAEKKQPKRRGALDRMQRGAAGRSAAGGAAAGPAAAGVGGEDEDDSGADEPGAGGRAGRRTAQKEQKKHDKRAQQAAEREARQQRDGTKTERQQKYSQRQADKEADRQRQEEEERQAKEEKEKQEQEEFDKWKEMFAVEAEGEEDAGHRDESAVERFINHVKVRKVVNLEDLAAEFRMRTSAAIDRLEQLEKLGRLSGIFDDRGKFIYITAEEMQGVAGWLQRKGRINRADLVAACNRIIRLNPTEEDKARLQEEAKSAAQALDEGADGAAGDEEAGDERTAAA